MGHHLNRCGDGAALEHFFTGDEKSLGAGLHLIYKDGGGMGADVRCAAGGGAASPDTESGMAYWSLSSNE